MHQQIWWLAQNILWTCLTGSQICKSTEDQKWKLTMLPSEEMGQMVMQWKCYSETTMWSSSAFVSALSSWVSPWHGMPCGIWRQDSLIVMKYRAGIQRESNCHFIPLIAYQFTALLARAVKLLHCPANNLMLLCTEAAYQPQICIKWYYLWHKAPFGRSGIGSRKLCTPSNTALWLQIFTTIDFWRSWVAETSLKVKS